MQLALKKFDPASLKTDSICVIVARRRSGKSFLVKDLLSYHAHSFAAAVVICPTEVFNHFYSDFIPPVFIHHEYKREILEKVIERQTRLKKRRDREIASKGFSNIDMSLLVLMDDCMNDTSWTRDPNIRFLFLNGRHIGVCFVGLMQYARNIPPDLRSQVDYSFLLKEPSLENRKKLYDCFATSFPGFDVYSQVLEQVTDNHGVLVTDTTNQSGKLEETVFWYKAEDPPPFKIGSRVFWEKNNKCFNPDETDDAEEMFDPKKPNAKKSTVKVRRDF